MGLFISMHVLINYNNVKEYKTINNASEVKFTINNARIVYITNINAHVMEITINTGCEELNTICNARRA